MNNTIKTLAVTLAIVATGGSMVVYYTGENTPATGEAAKITYAPDETIRFKVGSFTYTINSVEELETFALTVDRDDDENTIFARKIVKKLLASSTPEQAISKLEQGLNINTQPEEINID